MSKKTIKKQPNNISGKFNMYYQKYINFNFFKSLIFDSKYLLPVSIIVLLADIFVSVFIVLKVNYTEIDWKAYMQEVEGVVNGTFDYGNLKGDTGPLVYPAGFVYIYGLLYFLTNYGQNVILAQFIFVVIYAISLALIFRLYIKSKKVPPYVIALMCFTSYRIHSIYMLRLFNDPIATTLLYASLNLFLDNRWFLGSFFYSLAVSVKMNILLYAPGLLLAYLSNLGLLQTLTHLTICALVQVTLAFPFLLSHPYNYVKGAFDLGRIFLYKWTVNWRFIPEDGFVSQYFHIGLFILHLILLLIFYKICYIFLMSYSRLKAMEQDVKKQLKHRTDVLNMESMSQLFLFPMFLSNLIGITCSRSLHYQFYVWYYHTLPYLLWCTDLTTKTKLILLGLIELCWNTYPSTYTSSLVLCCCHISLLVNLYRHNIKRIQK